MKLVGASGFEPPTSASRTLRANQAALRPVLGTLYARLTNLWSSTQGDRAIFCRRYVIGFADTRDDSLSQGS